MHPNPCLSCSRKKKDKNNPVCKDCRKRMDYIKYLDLELNQIPSYGEIQPSPWPLPYIQRRGVSTP